MDDITHNTHVSVMGKERAYKYNNSELIIRFGDITESNTDVIVCSDDNMLSASGGTSKAIRDVCGDEIIHDIQKKRNAEIGDVVVTTAGNLPHKFLFHCITVGKDSHSDKSQEEIVKQQEYIIQHSISKCFRLLTSLDLTSMALSCIGAGYAAFNFERVGRVMSAVISDFLLKTNKSYRIELYLYGVREDFDPIDYIAFFEQFALRVPTENDYSKVQSVTSLQKEESSTQIFESKYDVFVSYSRLDKEKTDIVCQYLDKFGISYWIEFSRYIPWIMKMTEKE